MFPYAPSHQDMSVHYMVSDAKIHAFYHYQNTAMRQNHLFVFPCATAPELSPQLRTLLRTYSEPVVQTPYFYFGKLTDAQTEAIHGCGLALASLFPVSHLSSSVVLFFPRLSILFHKISASSNFRANYLGRKAGDVARTFFA